jgi:hypothetical protein
VEIKIGFLEDFGGGGERCKAMIFPALLCARENGVAPCFVGGGAG